MKEQRSSMSENAKDVLAIIAGQFLVVALKGDTRSLAQFREGYVAHCNKLLGSLTQDELERETVAAGRAFTAILAKRYGWDSNATAQLSEYVEKACRAWVSEADVSPFIEKLRIIDAWSGITSCTTERAVIPLSLLDYVLMVLLPVVCGQEIRTAVTALLDFGTYEVETLEAVDAALAACVSRLCCGINMSDAMMQELKLAVLLHFPKDNGRLSANEGLAYKLLQRQYANMGVN